MAGANPGDDGASSSVIAFMVAGVLFMASVVAVLVTTNNSSDSDSTGGEAAQNARFAIQASSLAEILLESPGFYQTGGVTSPLDWSNAADYNGMTDDADNLTRLGLLDADEAGAFMMDYSKFQNLRRAGYFANGTDGYVNYEEAVDGLGLAEAGLDFHVRAYPTLPSVADLLGPPSTRDSKLRVTYIGDIDVSKGSTPPANPTLGLDLGTPSCAISPLTSAGNPQAYRISLPVTNGGTTTTQFSALVEYELGGGSGLSQNTNGYLVAPGAVSTLFIDVPAVSGTDCNQINVHFHVHDPGSAIVEEQFETSPGVNGATAAPYDLWLDTDKPYFTNPTGVTSGCDDPVGFSYSGNELPKNHYVYLKVTDEAGTTTHYAASQQIPASANQREFSAGCLVAGNYLATLYYCGTSSCTGGSTKEQVVEQVLVTPDDVESYVPAGSSSTGPDTYVETTWATTEVQMLETLMGKFCPTYFDSKTTTPLSTAVDWNTRCSSFKAGMDQFGDVFPASNKILNDEMRARLLCLEASCPGAGFGGENIAEGQPRYDIANVLVVGSHVGHGGLTSEHFKGAVRDWVNGGGTLIVFGSDDGNTNWLQPLFHTGIQGNGGPISTPDQGHPMLHVPNELDNPGSNYDARETAWRFNSQTAHAQDDPDTALFTNVVVAGGTENLGDPLLAVSNQGAFSGGSIIITTYMPYDVYNDPALAGFSGSQCPGFNVTTCEGLNFMHNLLMQGYADLFLDYGPQIPQNTDVQPAMRNPKIHHPQLGDVELTMIVYVF